MAAGAALGAAFDMLFISVVDAGQKVACFSSRLNRLNSTLILIRRAVDDVEDFNRILERPQDETTALTDRLLQGEKLVRKCSRVKWWNVFTRLYYSVKLSKLEAMLLNFFQINVAALHFRESKRISCVVSNLEDKINELTTTLILNTTETETGACNFEDLAEIVVGNEGMELEDGENAVEVLASEACGEIGVSSSMPSMIDKLKMP